MSKTFDEQLPTYGQILRDLYSSLSVSRTGENHAWGIQLENHLEAIFKVHKLSYARRVVTENNQRPDFLFPSKKVYQDAPASGDLRLALLGAKSTCKDRWRQVLAEAAKIPRKHLLTIEPGISEPQTAQMDNANLQLVVPQSIHGSYTDKQQQWLWTLRSFIGEMERRGNKVVRQ